MEGSGANSNVVRARNAEGEETDVRVVATGDKVEIGGWLYRRDELLLAMGVNARPDRPQSAQAQIVVAPATIIDPAQEDSGGGGM